MCGFFVVAGVQPLSRGTVAEDDAQVFEWSASGRTRVASQNFVVWRSVVAKATPPHRLENIGRQRVLKLTSAMRAYLGFASGLPGNESIEEVMRRALASKAFDVDICLEGVRVWVMPASIWRRLSSNGDGCDFVTPATFMDLTGVRLSVWGSGRGTQAIVCMLLGLILGCPCIRSPWMSALTWVPQSQGVSALRLGHQRILRRRPELRRHQRVLMLRAPASASMAVHQWQRFATAVRQAQRAHPTKESQATAVPSSPRMLFAVLGVRPTSSSLR